MNRRTLRIGPIFLVFPENSLQALHEKQKHYPHLPEAAQIEIDINTLNDECGVPAIVVRNTKGGHETHTLLLYTPAYYMEIDESALHNGYTIKNVEPIHLQAHELLSQKSLLLCTTRWHIQPAREEIPRSQSSHWRTIEDTWDQAEDKTPQKALDEVTPDAQLSTVPGEHEQYLHTVNSLIDISRQLMRDKSTPYDREAVLLTQQQAVEALRTRTAKNPHLLPVLVDHTYLPSQLPTISPVKSLTDAQENAVRRALAIPDLLLIEGPPSSGKTRTIAEVIRHYGARKQRVLMAAKTRKAVDALMEQLHDELVILRLDVEDNSVGDMQSRLTDLHDVQVKRMQEVLLRKTENHAQLLTRVVNFKETIDQWITRLVEAIQSIKNVEAEIPIIQQRLMTIEQLINTAFMPLLDELAVKVKERGETLAHHKARLDSLSEHRNSAEPGGSALARSRPLTRLRDIRVEKLQDIVRDLQAEYDTLEQSYQEIEAARQQAFHDDPEYRWCEERIKQIPLENRSVLEDGFKATAVLNQTTLGLVPSQPSLEPLNVETLQLYLNWYLTIRPLLGRLYVILNDWRTNLSEHTEQFYSELLHYADVVCGTCSSMAAAQDLDGVDFDLAITDEAERIEMPHLLVSLVRAPRALLVGDTQQLPPFAHSEIRGWLDSLPLQSRQALHLDNETDIERAAKLLSTSIFEQLVTEELERLEAGKEGAGSEHLVHFSEQWRIPKIIADFVSGHFYENRLTTRSNDDGELPARTIPLFKSPLVVVDTASLLYRRRKEVIPGKRGQKNQKNGRSNPEGWGQSGYINVAEAKLLVDLATTYQREEKEWLILVPYRAQANLISHLLKKYCATEEINPASFKIDERVVTGETFQGTAQDVVLFGFTRSNTSGQVGLLQERRLLNVAMTHANMQVVMVGDMSTLKQAKDEKFRDLSLALYEYAQQHGELLSYEQCQYCLQTNNTP